MADDGEPIPLRGRKGGRTPTLSVPAITVPSALANEQLNPELRLETVLEMCRRAYEEYQEACAMADEFGAGAMPQGTDDNDLARRREEMRADVRKTYHRWFELNAHAKAAENEVRKRRLEEPLAGQWREEYEKVKRQLSDEYSGMGPQYDLLCNNLAALSIRMRQMEASGRDYDSSEYNDLHKLYLSYTNQLQKYTEAMKSESINRQTQDVAERLVQIFERRFAVAYPQEWKEAVTEITAMTREVA